MIRYRPTRPARSHARSASLAGAAALFAAGLALTAPAAGASTAGPATAACGNASIAVSGSTEQGATGHGSFVLHFRNKTSSACSLHGYPGLDAITSSGALLAHAQRTLSGFTGGSRHGIPTVVLSPNTFASADVEWLNFDPATGGDCVFSDLVAATPANTSHTVHLGRSVSVCNLQVHPTVAGLSGNG